MGLVICPECGNQYSDTRTECIHCGFSTIRTKPTSKNIELSLESKLMLVGKRLVISLIVFFVIGFISVTTTPTRTDFENHYREFVEQEQQKDRYETTSVFGKIGNYFKHNVQDYSVEVILKNGYYENHVFLSGFTIRTMSQQVTFIGFLGMIFPIDVVNY